MTEQEIFLCELDAQIAATIGTENKLEAEIIEAEAIQEAILDKISQIRQRIDSNTSPVTCSLNVSAMELIISEPVPRREYIACKFFAEVESAKFFWEPFYLEKFLGFV